MFRSLISLLLMFVLSSVAIAQQQEPSPPTSLVLPPKQTTFMPFLGLWCLIVPAPAGGAMQHCMTEESIPLPTLLELRQQAGIPLDRPIWHSASQQFVVPQLPPAPKAWSR